MSMTRFSSNEIDKEKKINDDHNRDGVLRPALSPPHAS